MPGGRRAEDLLLWLAITAPLLLPDDIGTPSGLPLWWVKLAAVPLLGLAVLLSRRRPLAAAAVPAALGLAASPELHTGTLTVAQAALAYLLGRRAPERRPAMAFFSGVCLAGAVLLLAAPAADAADGLNLVGGVLLVLVLPWLAGQYMRQRAELVRTGWQLAERLEQEQQLAVDRARLRERSRIAQDMHDSLGHALSLIAVRAGGLEMAEDVGPKGRQAAGELRRAAAAATRRLREVIGVLRDDGEGALLRPARESVADLVQRAAASGLTVSLDDGLTGPDGDKEAPPLPPMTDRAIFRVVQEALTNAAKHAEGAPVTVALSRDDAHAKVTVTNAPPPAGAPSLPENGGGYGLIGLDERVRQAGGTLHTGPAGGGFTVTARLPLAPGARATPPSELSTRREHAAARRTARRRMAQTIWLPAAAVAALLLVLILNDRGTQDNVLDERVYHQLRIGELRQAVEDRLPEQELEADHPPADPTSADECRYYRARREPSSPAYRLCFTDGRLSHKDTLNLDSHR
jgi:signal transduction histidine kinase